MSFALGRGLAWPLTYILAFSWDAPIAKGSTCTAAIKRNFSDLCQMDSCVVRGVPQWFEGAVKHLDCECFPWDGMPGGGFLSYICRFHTKLLLLHWRQSFSIKYSGVQRRGNAQEGCCSKKIGWAPKLENRAEARSTQDRRRLILASFFQHKLAVCVFLCPYPMNRRGVELHKGGNCSSLNTTTEEAAAFKHAKSEEKKKKTTNPSSSPGLPVTARHWHHFKAMRRPHLSGDDKTAEGFSLETVNSVKQEVKVIH